MATLASTWLPVSSSYLASCVTTGPNGMLVIVLTDGSIVSKLPAQQFVRYAQHYADKAKFAKSIALRADGSYVGIFTDNTVCTRSQLGGCYWFGEWPTTHLAIVTGNDGILIGVTDAGLQTSTKYNGPWYTVANSAGMISATQLQDGTVLGVGKDNVIYAWDTLSGSWTKFSDKFPVISLTEYDGRLVVVTTDNKLYSVPIVPATPVGDVPVPAYYRAKLKLVSDSFTEVDNNIVIKGSYEVQFSDTEVRLDIGYLALIDVEIPANISADWKVTPKRVSRNVGTFTPAGQATRVFSFEQTIGKDELLHTLHSTRAFNDASIALSMRLQIIPTILGGELTTADVVTLGAVVAPTTVTTATTATPTDTTVSQSEPAGALMFNGTDTYVEVKTPLPFTSQATIEMWMRGVPKDAFLFYVTDDSGRRQLSGSVPWSDGNVYFDSGADAGNIYNRIVKALSPVDDKSIWNHWAFVFDQPAGRMSIYKNGALWLEKTGMTRPMAPCNRLVIGAHGDVKEYYNGAICEVRLWSVARTASQIMDNMNRRIPGADAGLIVSYALDQPVQAGQSIPDRSGGGRNGVLRGTTVGAAKPSTLL